MMQKIDTFKQKKALKIFLKNLNISNNYYEIKSDSKFKIKKSKRSIRFLTFYFGLATNSRIKPSACFNVYF